VGAIVGGRASAGGVDHDVAPGVAASLTGSWLALYEGEARPFVLLALTLSGSTTTTTLASGGGAAQRLTAFDARLSVLAGKTFLERVTPYAAARVFGGPVWWTLDGAGVTGGDQHHYALGAGVTVRLPGALDVFVEGMALGERSLNAGAGLAF
jgi:hypothetical protein